MIHNKSHTAGLETELNIGINSAIMLLRNLDTAKGLVNGALGYVHSLNFNGNKNTPIVNTIGVKFHHIEEIVIIERFIADFEGNSDQYITRAQFPLTLAWAITIHKCQGLSLNSIILDIGPDIFEGGMAYVGLSRARLLSTVHLIELDPTVLYCCAEAMEEYIRLYEKAGIECTLPRVYNVLPTSVSTKNNKRILATNKKKKKHNDKDPQSLEISSESRTNNSYTLLDMKTYPLRLMQINNNCYTNVVVQALINLSPHVTNLFLNFNTELIDGLVGKSLFNEFRNLYLYQFQVNKKINASVVKQLVGQHFNTRNYQSNEQEDCYLFLIDVISLLPLQIQDLFKVNIIVDSTCQICKQSLSNVDAAVNNIQITLTHNKKTDFQQCLQLNATSEQTCTKCNKTTVHNDKSTIVNNNNTQYIIVYVHQYTYINNAPSKIKSKLSNLKQKYYQVSSIDNARYVLKALIVRQGEETNSGHYKIWNRNNVNDKWLYISDENIRQYNELYDSIENVLVIILQKIQ